MCTSKKDGDKMKNDALKNRSIKQNIIFWPCLIKFDFGSFFSKVLPFFHKPFHAKLILWLCLWPCVVTNLFVTRGCLWNFLDAPHIFHLAPATLVVVRVSLEPAASHLRPVIWSFWNTLNTRIVQTSGRRFGNCCIQVSGEQKWMSFSIIFWSLY